jgi:hypothetical protein
VLQESPVYCYRKMGTNLLRFLPNALDLFQNAPAGDESFVKARSDRQTGSQSNHENIPRSLGSQLRSRRRVSTRPKESVMLTFDPCASEIRRPL